MRKYIVVVIPAAIASSTSENTIRQRETVMDKLLADACLRPCLKRSPYILRTLGTRQQRSPSWETEHCFKRLEKRFETAIPMRGCSVKETIAEPFDQLNLSAMVIQMIQGESTER
jgi:hypothetical protein